MKRIFIIHGWGGFPEEGWFPWLKKELEQNNFKVEILSMPNTNNPTIKEWVGFLKKNVKDVDCDTFFVGHSIGCQAILRYLEKLNTKVGGAIFVAPWFNLMSYEAEEEKEIAKPWIKRKINFEKVCANCNWFTAIFSDNDPFVPLSDIETFKEKLNAKIIMEYDKGHFSGSDDITELQCVLDELIKN